MKKFVVNEEFLQSLETLQLFIKNNVAGQFGGNNRSRSFGSSCEFADYRDYMAGDDVDRIDWNAYARFDKLYLKLYLDERQMHTRIYIDTSRSMSYGEGKKAEQAIRLAAAIAYLSVSNMDKVSVYAVGGNTVREVLSGIVGKDAYTSAIGRLNDISFEGDFALSDAILPTEVGYGDGVSVVISDFLTDSDYERAIDHLVAKWRDVLALQVLDSEELKPQYAGRYHFFDSEDLSKEYRKHIDKSITDAYRKALAFVTDRLRNHCDSRGAKYALIRADAPLSEVFLRQLTAEEVVL